MSSLSTSVIEAYWQTHTDTQTHRFRSKERCWCANLIKQIWGVNQNGCGSAKCKGVRLQSSKCIKREHGFPWGDSAVLWAWASHPVTMDHCLALSKGENMCTCVSLWVCQCVCVCVCVCCCTCNWILKEWADWCESGAVICLNVGAGRGTNTDKHAPILGQHLKSIQHSVLKRMVSY